MANRGYVLVKAPGHPRANSWGFVKRAWVKLLTPEERALVAGKVITLEVLAETGR